jgi:arylsulfatase A-like enzyme
MDMHRRDFLRRLGAGAVALGLSSDRSTRGDQVGKRPPNILLIVSDDQGYNDLGCYGSDEVRTPNLDRLAAEGVRLTDFYVTWPACTPSRGSLLTGRYPQRNGTYDMFRNDKVDYDYHYPPGEYAVSWEMIGGMDTREVLIPKVLGRAGYVSGIFGKWDLGQLHRYLPLQRGFDEYFGIPYSNDMESVVYMEGNEVVDFNVDQTYTTKTYTEKSVDFINRHKDQPFFLYLAHSMPHVPIYASEDFLGSSDRGLYGDVIQELDWSVGEVMRALEDNGLKDNTLLVFSSDNGPWLVMREHGGSSGILREGKQYTFEGGVRVPTLAMWPKVIPAGSVYQDMAVMCDWFPTIAAMAGAELPNGLVLDGENIMPVLEGSGKRKGDQWLYFDGQNLECYRHGDWKVKRAFGGSPPMRWKKHVDAHPVLLINLKEDPGEENNLADVYPERLERMMAEMDSMREAMGELPPMIPIKSNADHSHYEYLIETYGPDYYVFD